MAGGREGRASPIGLPDVDGVLIPDVVLLGLLIQEIKEILDGGRHGIPGRQHTLEKVVHKLLQCALWRRAAGCDPPGTQAPGCGGVYLCVSVITLTESSRVR